MTRFARTLNYSETLFVAGLGTVGAQQVEVEHIGRHALGLRQTHTREVAHRECRRAGGHGGQPHEDTDSTLRLR